MYGPPARLGEVEVAGRARGPPQASHRHVVALLSLDGGERHELPAGERRPANLEDVFVLLTGEEIA